MHISLSKVKDGAVFVRSGRKYIVFIFILSLLLANLRFSAPAEAEGVERSGTRGVIIVNASGGGDYTHIQWAIDNASSGDTVVVEAGTYYENVVVNKTISLVGAGEENTTIDAGRKGSVVKIISDFVNITGFQIINSSYRYGYGIFVYNSNYCTVQNNNCSSNSVGIRISESYHISIFNNICIQNEYGGISLYNSENNNIYGNTCNSNYGDGIILYSSDYNGVTNNFCTQNVGAGIDNSNSDGSVISNNFCTQNVGAGIDNSNSDGSVISNNLCTSNDDFGIAISNS